MKCAFNVIYICILMRFFLIKGHIKTMADSTQSDSIMAHLIECDYLN